MPEVGHAADAAAVFPALCLRRGCSWVMKNLGVVAGRTNLIFLRPRSSTALYRELVWVMPAEVNPCRKSISSDSPSSGSGTSSLVVVMMEASSWSGSLGIGTSVVSAQFARH